MNFEEAEEEVPLARLQLGKDFTKMEAIKGTLLDDFEDTSKSSSVSSASLDEDRRASSHGANASLLGSNVTTGSTSDVIAQEEPAGRQLSSSPMKPSKDGHGVTAT